MSKYPYFELPTPTGSVLKPYVYVWIGYKKTHKITNAQIMALIDSGADVCFCKKIIGEWLGIQFKNKPPQEFLAANKSKFCAFKEVITLYFSGKSYEQSFYFTDEIPEQTPVILGQKGFFDHFKITFDLKNKEIEIT